MSHPKTPCIGICSTTSLGDSVCRGCKRYSFEVINWNSYDAEAKLAVLMRIEKLVCQIIERKLTIYSISDLKAGLKRANIPFDLNLSPYCWLHNLLKKRHDQIDNLNNYGVAIDPSVSERSVVEIFQIIEEDLLALSQAHFDRYLSHAIN